MNPQQELLDPDNGKNGYRTYYVRKGFNVSNEVGGKRIAGDNEIVTIGAFYKIQKIAQYDASITLFRGD